MQKWGLLKKIYLYPEKFCNELGDKWFLHLMKAPWSLIIFLHPGYDWLTFSSLINKRPPASFQSIFFSFLQIEQFLYLFQSLQGTQGVCTIYTSLLSRKLAPIKIAIVRWLHFLTVSNRIIQTVIYYMFAQFMDFLDS